MDEYSDDGLRENDPYKDMEAQEKRSIVPDFLALGGTAGGENKRKKAAGDLRGAEDSAKEQRQLTRGGVAGAAANERAPGALTRGLYAGKDKPESGKSANDKGTEAKGALKKFGPMGVIAAVITAVGGLLVGAQALMPVAISELLIDKFNSIGVSSTVSSDVWLDSQLNYGVTQQYVATEEKGNLFRFSDEQKSEFEKHGIKVVEGVGDGSVTSITALLYKKNGVWIPIVGSDMLKYNGYSESDLINAIKYASGLDNIGLPVSVATAMRDEKEFKLPYTTASKVWRGGISGWFDTLMADITEIKLNVTRNRWLSFAAKSLTQAKATFKQVAAGAGLEKSNTGKMASKEDTPLKDGNGQDILDGDGNQISSGDASRVDDDSVISGSSSAGEVESRLTSKAMAAAQAVGMAADGTCALVNGAITIYTLVSAYQGLQYLNLISGFLESVDKMKAGYGDESPINEYSTNLVTLGDTVDRNTDEVVARKTAMESAGMAQLFTPAATIKSGNVSVQNVNFETVMSDLTGFMGNIKSLTEAAEICRAARVGTAALGLATSVISFVPLLGQGVMIGQVLAKQLGTILIEGIAAAVISALIPIATKAIVKMIAKNAATEWFGEDLGNALISGANKYLGGNGSTGAQSPTGETKLLQYAGVRDTVIAEEAKYQRATRDPLDISSKYTFMGSLVYSLMPLAYSGGAMGVLSSLSTLTGSSLIALTPAASAVSEENLLNSKGDCDILESVGGVGDAFCNAYVVTDVSTIAKDPVTSFRNAYYAAGEYETWYRVCPGASPCYLASKTDSYTPVIDNGTGDIVWPSASDWEANGEMIKHGPDGDGEAGSNFISKVFNADGTSVLKDSTLAKYIIYCGERTSQYGLQDGTIADKISGGSTAKSIISMVPVIGDLTQLGDAIKEKENEEFITGQACVANSDPKYNPKWETEYKYYQRYVENERLLENMYMTYTSPVSKAFAEYHAENPIDTSFEGTLARFSGMTVDQVDSTLALLEYYEYVTEYDPSERLAFGAPAVVEDDAIFFESDTRIAAEYFIRTNETVYADVRNRVNLV